LSRSFPRYDFTKEADLASEGIDFNDLAILLRLTADAIFKLNTTVDQVLDKRLFTGGVTGNSLLSQFLVALPILPREFRLAMTTFLKAT
jgi:hypothetical protein